MAKEWYYEDKADYWQGPFEPVEMKKLASVGMIQKETRVRKGEKGPTAKGENVKGLFDGEKDLSILQTITTTASTVTQGIAGIASRAFSAVTDTATKAVTDTASLISSAAKGASDTFIGTIAAFTPKPGKPIEEVIGSLIQGAHIPGTPSSKLCSNLPSNFFRETVHLFLHSEGLRIQPPKGTPILITKNQMVSAQQKHESKTVTKNLGILTTLGTASGVVVGGLFFGPTGALVGTVAGSIFDNSIVTTEQNFVVDVSFINEKNEMSRLVLLADKQDAKNFTGHLQQLLGISPRQKLLGFW